MSTALDPVAGELAAMWAAFREAANAPDSSHAAFESVAGPLLQRAHDAEERAASVPAALLALAPYVHGDPRVDRWEVSEGGRHAPTHPAVAGFEPLAAWTPLCPSGAGFMWERPLRHCEAPPATTEESALAALLTAWDAWPDGLGRFSRLLSDITADLERAGLAIGPDLTETALAIVARAAERGQP